MKKKLLVIVLAFCCVWGVFASKLTDAASSGDFDTMKKQIELLDVNVNENIENKGTLIDCCLTGWGKYNYINTTSYYNRAYPSDRGVTKTTHLRGSKFTDREENYRKCVQYLFQNGAELSDSCIRTILTDYHYNILAFLLDNKYLDINRRLADGKKNTISLNDYFFGKKYRRGSGRPDACITALVLLSNDSNVSLLPKGNDAMYYLLSGNINGIKEVIKGGTSLKYSEELMFVSNPKVIEFLEAAEEYQLPSRFDTAFSVCPYYLNTILPKYCSHLFTQDELSLINILVNYDLSKNYDTELAKVKSLLQKGIDLDKQHLMLDFVTIFSLPILIHNYDAFNLICDARDDTANVLTYSSNELNRQDLVLFSSRDQERPLTITNYLLTMHRDYFGDAWYGGLFSFNDASKCTGNLRRYMLLSNDDVEILKNMPVMKKIEEEKKRIQEEQEAEKRRIAAEKAEQERIAREKAEAERKAAEDKFVTEFIPKYKTETKTSLSGLLQTQYKSLFKEVKGRYELKKAYRGRGIDTQILDMMKLSAACYELNGSYRIGIFEIKKDNYKGITIEYINNCCEKAIKEVFNELVIQ